MEDTTRIVILGNGGVGKSSLANTIFGEDVFSVNDSPNNSPNRKTLSTCKKINGKNVQLVKIPSVFHLNPRSIEQSPELLECFTECAPGPHAFLLVLKVGRFDIYEKTVVDIILSYFTEDALKYTTVVFTHGEDLPYGMKIEDWVEQNEDLTNLVQKCDGRCHVIDNKNWKKQEQAQRLLMTVHTMVVKNNNRYYSNEMLEKIDNDVQKEKEGIRQKQVNRVFTAVYTMVNNIKSLTSEMRENIRRKIQKEKTMMNEKLVESIRSTVDKIFEVIRAEVMKNVKHYAHLILTEILSDIQKKKESIMHMVQEILTGLVLQLKAKVYVHGKLICSLGGAVIGVLLGAFLGVKVMLAVVTTSSPSLLKYILKLLAVAGAILVLTITGGFLGGVVGWWLWEKLFSTAKEAEIHLQNLDRHYGKLQ